MAADNLLGYVGLDFEVRLAYTEGDGDASNLQGKRSAQ
jgi:hypothetical protein